MGGDPALGDGECHAFGGASDTELVPHFSEYTLDVTLGVSEAFGEAGKSLAVGKTLQAGKLHVVGCNRRIESAIPSHGGCRSAQLLHSIWAHQLGELLVVDHFRYVSDMKRTRWYFLFRAIRIFADRGSNRTQIPSHILPIAKDRFIGQNRVHKPSTALIGVGHLPQ
ncbi:MAG: hypothetical protein OXG67_02125 [bacterium]|nr:hypothetical protein [bacterium]